MSSDATPCGCGRTFEHHHGAGGMIPGPAPASETYRGATPEEAGWSNPQTPREFDQRVRLVCKDGLVETAEITFEDGTPLKNVLRAVVSLESPLVRGANGRAEVFVTQFNNEIGRIVFGVAEALVG